MNRTSMFVYITTFVTNENLKFFVLRLILLHVIQTYLASNAMQCNSAKTQKSLKSKAEACTQITHLHFYCKNTCIYNFCISIANRKCIVRKEEG